MTIVEKKCRKKYETNGLPVELILHSGVGHQVLADDHVKKAKSHIEQMIRRSPFSAIHVFDDYGDRRLLLTVKEK